MRKLALMATMVALLAAGGTGWAEPYIAVRTGMRCSNCHVNMTGGGMRNVIGRTYAKTTLPFMDLFFNNESSPAAGDGEKPAPKFSEQLTDHVAIGGNLRVANNSAIGERASNNLALQTNEFVVNEGNLYLAADLLDNRLTFYVDETLLNSGGGVVNREAFALVKAQPFGSYLKVGRFMPAYGFRVFDDTTFTREFSGFTYSTPDLGLEVGIEPKWFTWSASLTNGDSGGTGARATTRLEILSPIGRIGGSFSWNNGEPDNSFRFGPFLGTSFFEKLAIFGEWMIGRDEGTTDVDSWAALGEIDYLVFKGLNLKFNYQYYDPNLDVDGDFRTRVVTGAEFFVTQFVQLSGFFRANTSIPQKPEENDEELFLEGHVFF